MPEGKGGDQKQDSDLPNGFPSNFKGDQRRADALGETQNFKDQRRGKQEGKGRSLDEDGLKARAVEGCVLSYAFRHAK